MSYLVCNQKATRYMLPSGRWSTDIDNAKSFTNQKVAVKYGLKKGLKTFMVLPAREA
jgi:hypothetical protein